MKKFRVWAEIDLSALKNNVSRIRERLPSGVGVISIVKADAYGHGALPVARACLDAGAGMLAVGDSSEALELRNGGVLAPILILGALIEEEIGWVVSFDIIPALHGPGMIPLLEQEAERQGKRVKVHIKVDTGMVRLGVSPELALKTAERVDASDRLVLDGVCTHLSSSSEIDRFFTLKQLDDFRGTLKKMRPFLGPGAMIHAANSAAAFRYPAAAFTHVRPGIATLGIDPDGSFGTDNRDAPALEPVLSLKTQVCFLKGVYANTPVGYGRTAVPSENTRLAVLPIGYNDGYPYALSNRAEVLIRGCRAPIIGTVTMDYTTVDAGSATDVQVGDEVVLIGRQKNEEITAGELAGFAGTIPYEIFCLLGKRIRRIYV